jgi:magnesium transporter
MTIPENMRLRVFLGLTPYIQAELIQDMSDADIVPLLESLDPLALSHALRQIPTRRREALLSLIRKSVSDSATNLLSFDEHTAAGFMHTDYIQIEQDETIETCAEKVREYEHTTGKIPVILGMKDGLIAGTLPVYELGLSIPKDLIQDHLQRVIMISSSTSYNEMLRTFRTHPHSRIIVINDRGAVMGVVYSEDVLAYIHESGDGALSDFAGLHKEENAFDSARKKVGFRWKWLIINLGTAFLASAVVGSFEGTLARNVLLAVYLPIVAGMGGNAATQTLALLVRSISLGQITLANCGRALWNEVKAGFFNGLINAAIVFTVVTVSTGQPMIGFVLGIALIFNLMIAGFFGTLVPLLMQRWGKDPASSATIFITTATDICGFFAFLGLATLLIL